MDHVFRDQPDKRGQARVLRIGSTLQLEEFRVSENLIGEMRSLPGYLEDSGPEPYVAAEPFDPV